ncbi:MAG: PAS domain S-box protein [Deltaproteobacteria bacterium]|nr:PAS domain S-box protein [Deltaproteobacteria bacterium]MBN2674720.1 PAS domain S-box protein [Deltaproteobacteria bacterium]
MTETSPNTIAELQRQNQLLTEERERLIGIIEGARVGTWEWNIQTGEVAFNEMWAEFLGYTLADLAPINIDTWERLAHPDDLKLSGALLEKHFSGELPWYSCECRMRHRNGHWVWVYDHGKIITRTTDGKPLMMFGTHMDITERKMSEQALMESKTAAERYLNIAAEIIMSLDREGNITLLNDNGHAMLGYAKGELIGKTGLTPACRQQTCRR